MKLFMEVNPQLFDDCLHEHTEAQQNAPARLQQRQSKWDRLAEQAKARQNGKITPTPAAPPTLNSKPNTPLRSDDADPISQDSRARLEALRLQDDTVSANSRDRRTKDSYERPNSSSVR